MAGIDAGTLLLSLGAGGVLGFFYFGGLWLTVRHLPRTQRPGLWVLASFGGRLAVLLPLLLWLGAGHFDRLLVATLGLLVVRQVLTKWWGSERESRRLGESHGDHA